MKCIFIAIICLSAIVNSIIGLHLTKLAGGPPRANDLSDHFGTNPSANAYGPVTSILGVKGDLMRQGMLSGIPITPITNLDLEINPKEVVAGDLLNTAPDASKIINPNIASI
jgi:hypothetical protein